MNILAKVFVLTSAVMCSNFVYAEKTKKELAVNKNHDAINQINAESLKAEMESNKNLVVINVLAKEYFDDAHITGSINKSLDNLAELQTEYSENTPIVVYCASYQCPASRDAYKQLVEMGFTNIRAYEGGIKEWIAKGFAYQGPAKKEYLRK